MKTFPKIWYTYPMDPLPGETLQQFHDQIRSVVPPVEILYYEGRLYLSDAGITLLLQACNDGRIPNGEIRAREMNVTYTRLFIPAEWERFYVELIVEGDLELANLVYDVLLKQVEKK